MRRRTARKGHCHVRRVFGHDPGGVGYHDPASVGLFDLDVIKSRAVIGNQLELRTRLGNQRRVDTVRQCRHQNIRRLHRSGQLIAAHWCIIRPQGNIEKLGHTGLNVFGQPSRNDNTQLRL